MFIDFFNTQDGGMTPEDEIDVRFGLDVEDDDEDFDGEVAFISVEELFHSIVVTSLLESGFVKDVNDPRCAGFWRLFLSHLDEEGFLLQDMRDEDWEDEEG